MAGFGSLASPLASAPRNRSPYGDEQLYPVSPWHPRIPSAGPVAGRDYDADRMAGWMLNMPQYQTEEGVPYYPRFEPSPGFADYLRHNPVQQRTPFSLSDLLMWWRQR